MNLMFLIALSGLLMIGLTAAHFHRGLYVLLLLLPASDMLGFVDPMTFAVKGSFDIHALLAILILAAVLFSVNRWQELRSTLLLKPMLVFVGLWLFGVLYPVTQDNSSLFYALKGSKEFLTIFAYFAVFPMVFGFITASAPKGVAVMTDIDKYLSFVLSMFLAFGVTFQVPVAVVAMVKMGFVSVAKLRAIRRYVIVGAFIAGAILTPPDVVSQFMLAIPLWLLYEAGILVAVWMVKAPKTEESTAEKTDLNG